MNVYILIFQILDAQKILTMGKFFKQKKKRLLFLQSGALCIKIYLFAQHAIIMFSQNLHGCFKQGRKLHV